MTDIVIIGGGVSGMTAALYAARSGLDVVILEKTVFGGQVASTATIENFPSLISTNGSRLAHDMKTQIDLLSVKSVYSQAQKIEKHNGFFTVTTDTQCIDTKTVIIANGVKRRQLGIKGEKEFTGKGVSWCAVCDGSFFKNRDVAVIGGANSALSDAIYLSSLCKKVYLIFRKNAPTASTTLQTGIKSINNIELIPNRRPTQIIGEKRVKSLEIENVKTSEKTVLNIDGVFEAIGLMPDNKCFENVVTLDEAGYIIADENCCTSTSGIFAAGDTRVKSLRQIVTATSDGAIAATSALEYINQP